MGYRDAIRMIYKELGLKGLTPVFKTTRPAMALCMILTLIVSATVSLI